MKRLFFFLALLSEMAWAHEVQLITQHLKLNRQRDSGLQTDLLGRAILSRKWEAGLQGTYLERFDFYEKRVGALLVYRPSDTTVLEARYYKGDDVEILPHDQYNLSLYHSFSQGLSPFLLYKNALYTVTHLQSLDIGLEIEKIQNIVIVPRVMVGQARFDRPEETKDVYSYGLRVIYYREGIYSFYAFGYKGTEAAQGVIGRSNLTIDTTTGGLGASYYFIPDLKTEIIFDYTDYEQINNQFLTTTLNLAWTFE